MININKFTCYWRYRLWLLALLWFPLQVMGVAPRLSVESFSIVSGGTKTIPILLNNPDNAITLLQFDMQLPEGLTLKATTSGDYEMNMTGRTMWRNHSLVANQLTDGRIRMLLCSSTNTLIEGNDGAIITLTLQAADDFKDGQMVLNNILMVGADGQESKQDRYECTVKSLPKPVVTKGTATLSCQPISINVGEEAELAVSLNNQNEEITLVQFDLEMPDGLSIKSGNGNLAIKMAGRTSEKDHSLQVVQLANKCIRVLLSSDKNATIQGNNGPVISMTLKAAENFSSGFLKFTNILLVGPNEQESTQESYQQPVTAIVPDPVLATSIILGLSKSKMYTGEKLQATCSLQPTDVTSQIVSWKSSNTAVATITDDGLIEAVGPGTTTISVSTTDGSNLSDSKQITVEVLATKISLTISKTTINAGEELQAAYTILPDNVSSKQVEWESSNPNVATIDAQGLISAVGLGTALITVKTTDGSKLSDSKQITVNEKMLDIVINDILFRLYTWQKKASVIKIADNRQDNLTIPESIENDNTNYQVTAIADSALAMGSSNDNFRYLSLTIPASVNSISDSAFDGLRALSIIYNGDGKLTTHHIDEIHRISQNVLLYVKNDKVLPSEGLTNVVIDGTSQSVILTEQNEFHCPQQFTSKQVSYTHRFTMETGIGESSGWETIVLPFDVETISHETKGNLVPFSVYATGLDSYRPFWLYELSTNGFVKASAIEANKPYLISMPNNSKYTADYNLNGNVTFAAVNALIKSTNINDLNQQVNSHEGKAFTPIYRFMDKSEGGYAINAITDFYALSGGKSPGSIFIKGLRRINPFEGYFKYENANAQQYIDISFANEATYITNVYGREQLFKVFTISGQMVGTCTYEDLTKHHIILPAGVYIINGQKVVIK